VGRPPERPVPIRFTMRTLTVSTLYRPRRKGGTGPVPHLRLTGQWLASHGFKAGSKITVTAANGTLILSHSEP